MSKYIKIFFGTLVIGFVIFFIGNGFFNSSNLLETTILSIGAVNICFLSYLIAQVHYLIDLVKK
ncbi:hypothetical protein GCM10008983_07780 [Lentibacillus halophilus]|uniref:Uncharacterized protein n=1 Tax=Lentibacillus halophilus TaxID=295065 RepID=A0ABP3IYQ8_9BACI